MNQSHKKIFNSKNNRAVFEKTINSLLIGKLNGENLQLYQYFINKSLINLNSDEILNRMKSFNIKKLEIKWIFEDKIFNELTNSLNSIKRQLLNNFDLNISDNIICFQNEEYSVIIEMYNYNDILFDYKLKENIFNKINNQLFFIEGLSYLDFLKLNIYPKINVNEDFSTSLAYKFKLCLISQILFDLI